MTTELKGIRLNPGTTVHIIRGTPLHDLLGDTAVVGKGMDTPPDDPEHIPLIDPKYNRPRICRREYVIECQ
jgi:hypothetical protein